MKLHDQEQVAKRLEGLVHLETQGFSFGVDLTVAEIHRLKAGGKLDFGGSEFEAAKTEKLSPKKADPEDDYGWWHLEAGSYLLRYNERVSLDKNELALISPHARLLQAGASHGTFNVSGDEGLKTLLYVPESGISLKENARVSRLIIFAS